MCQCLFGLGQCKAFCIDIVPFVDQLVWLEGADKLKAYKLLFKTFGFERTRARYHSVYIYYL